MKKTLVLLFCSVVFTTSFAQEGVSTKEAGAYQRKSVAFLNVLVNKGGLRGSRLSVSDYEIVEILQNAVRFERFDYNNVPQNIVDRFVAMPFSLSIEERMNETVVPAILAAVDANKEIRAVSLLSEQQKNSFITDKAKELGITADELNAVMNSAYIFAPVYLGYSDSSYSTSSGATAYKLTLSAGGYWWKIDNSGENPSAKLIAHIERTYSSTKYSGEKYIHNGQIIGYREAAFFAALNTVALDVQTATREIPEFQLSAQILDKNPRNVIISIGTREGVHTDDKFWVYQSYEDESGKITDKKRGWIMVKKVGEKVRGLDDSQSKAQIIAGSPYIGSTVKEIPQLPFDLSVGFTTSPVSVDDKGQRKFDEAIENLDKDADNYESMLTYYKTLYLKDIRHLKLSNIYGVKIKPSVNLFSRAGVSQWWLNLYGEFFAGAASGNICYSPDSYGKELYDIDAAFGFEAGLSLTKKIFIRRLVLAPELGLGVKSVMLDPNYNSSDSYEFYVSQTSIGLLGNMGVEFAITPTLHLGVSGGYRLFAGNGTWSSRWRYKSSNYASESESSEKNKYRDGPSVSSGDWLNPSGAAWSLYVSFTIPHASKGNNDMVEQENFYAPNSQKETDEQTPANDKYKSENDKKETAPKKKQNGGAGEFFRSIFSL